MLEDYSFLIGAIVGLICVFFMPFDVYVMILMGLCLFISMTLMGFPRIPRWLQNRMQFLGGFSITMFSYMFIKSGELNV